jgi:factor associated with neutral sphingomyelinase activation
MGLCVGNQQLEISNYGSEQPPIASQQEILHHAPQLLLPPLQATMQQAAAGLRFDLGGLRSPNERIALELGCTLLSQGALVREPGRLLITDRRLYFQPLHNISGDAAVSSHPLTAVAAAARRRSSLRDLALEVFFADPSAQQAQHAQQTQQRQQEDVGGPFWGGASALFAFSSRDDREQAVATLMAQQALGRALPGGQDAAAACAAILEVRQHAIRGAGCRLGQRFP